MYFMIYGLFCYLDISKMKLQVSLNNSSLRIICLNELLQNYICYCQFNDIIKHILKYLQIYFKE